MRAGLAAAGDDELAIAPETVLEADAADALMSQGMVPGVFTERPCQTK